MFPVLTELVSYTEYEETQGNYAGFNSEIPTLAF